MPYVDCRVDRREGGNKGITYVARQEKMIKMLIITLQGAVHSPQLLAVYDDTVSHLSISLYDDDIPIISVPR